MSYVIGCAILSRMAIKDEKLFEKLLIPVRRVTFHKGFFRWPAHAILASCRSPDIVPLEQLRDDLSKYLLKARIVRNAFGPAAVRIYRDKNIASCQAYSLIITPGGIEIYASSDAGA